MLRFEDKSGRPTPRGHRTLLRVVPHRLIPAEMVENGIQRQEFGSDLFCYNEAGSDSQGTRYSKSQPNVLVVDHGHNLDDQEKVVRPKSLRRRRRRR